MWSVIGLGTALALAAAAWLRSRAPSGYYDGAVYGMTPAIHRRYTLAALFFGLFFVATLALHAVFIAVAGLAVFAVVAILYGSSFLRGASEDHE